MLDLYGSNVPPALHTRTPTCPPGPQPLSTMPTEQLISALLPSFLFLLILPWLIVHLPKTPPPQPPQPPQPAYVIYAWGGEETPIFWKPDYPQATQETNSTEVPNESTPPTPTSPIRDVKSE